MQGVKWWKNIVLVKSLKEIEGKYVDYLFSLTSKRDVSVGPLVVDSVDVDSEQNSVIQWLDTKTTRSIIFVSLGSEYFLSKADMGWGRRSGYFLADMTQIALGLEISNENFIWVPRFPKGQNNMSIKEALPLGSVTEAMKFYVLIIEMPMHLHQPINARLVVEIRMGKEVVRNNKGVLIGAKVAEIVNEVVASNIGKNTMDKAKKISDDLETKGDEEIEYVVDELLQLCQSGHKLRRVGAPL
ncbi:hypothetical protein Tco_0164553 [Tanacetum coccineum]